MRRALTTSLFALAFLSASVQPASAALIDPVRFVHLEGSQWYAFGNAAYLAYTSNSIAHPDHWDAFARDRASGVRTKMNAARTMGFTGGFDPGTNVGIYQEINGPTSTIYFFDLDTDIRSKVPGINTTKWEWGPRISSTYISFVRNERVNGRDFFRIYLYDRLARTRHAVAKYRIDRIDLLNGSVGDRYATWSFCDGLSCYVVVYDTLDGSTTVLDAPKNRPQYGSVIDEASGMLYFLRSGFGCGVTVGMWQQPVDGSSAPTKIAVLPDGVDADEMSLALNPDTLATDLLFSRAPCRRNGDVDIWSVPGVLGP